MTQYTSDDSSGVEQGGGRRQQAYAVVVDSMKDLSVEVNVRIVFQPQQSMFGGIVQRKWARGRGRNV